MLEKIKEELIPAFGSKQYGMDKLLPEKASLKTIKYDQNSGAELAWPT